MVRMSEVNDCLREEGYHHMIRELSSVIYGESSSFFYRDTSPCVPYRFSYSLRLLSPFELHGDEISGLSLYERQYRPASILADDRVSFPVSYALSCLHFLRSLVNHSTLLNLMLLESLFLFSITILLSLPSEVCSYELAVMFVDPIVHRIFRERFMDSCCPLFSHP